LNSGGSGGAHSVVLRKTRAGAGVHDMRSHLEWRKEAERKPGVTRCVSCKGIAHLKRLSSPVAYHNRKRSTVDTHARGCRVCRRGRKCQKTLPFPRAHERANHPRPTFPAAIRGNTSDTSTAHPQPQPHRPWTPALAVLSADERAVTTGTSHDQHLTNYLRALLRFAIIMLIHVWWQRCASHNRSAASFP